MNEEVKFLEREEAKVSFIEAYSAFNVSEYCFLDENNKPLHPQVRCKDYIQDLFWMSKLIDSNSDNNKIEEFKNTIIYGFKPYNYCILYPFINRDFYRVGIRFRTEGQNFRQYDNKHVELAQQIIIQIETSFEFPTSKVSLSKSKEILIFEFSSKWTTMPYLVSLYLLLIRVLSKASIEDMESIEDFKQYLLDYPKSKSGNEAQNLAGGSFLLKKLFKENIFPEQKWEDYKTINEIHNDSGVSSFSKFLKAFENQKKSQKEPQVMPTNSNSYIEDENYPDEDDDF